MKLILSRKGFDSSSGGKPSPIFPDRRMVSLLIPDRMSTVSCADIRWYECNMGSLVSDLTDSDIPASYKAHLDPDLRHDSLPRVAGWKPLFGQIDAAQGHLRRCGVSVGDIFLFFGLFRRVVDVSGKLAWDTSSEPCHVVWGWLQVGDVLQVDLCDRARYSWATYHPHFHRGPAENNTVYVGRADLNLAGVCSETAKGGHHYFSSFHPALRSRPTPRKNPLVCPLSLSVFAIAVGDCCHTGPAGVPGAGVAV